MRRSSIITQSSLKVAIAFFLCTSYTAIAQQIPLKKENSKNGYIIRSKDIDEVVVVGFGKQKS